MPDEHKKALVAKTVFWIGTIGDGLIGIEWLLICLGIVNLPIIPSFFTGHGLDFRFAMGAGAVFMLAWTAILYWGSRCPLERRGLLLITAIFLFIALVGETIGYFTFFTNAMTANQLALGFIAKLYLVVQFGFAYWYSDRR